MPEPTGLPFPDLPEAPCDDELTWVPALRIAEMIGTRDVSPIEVARHFLDRIDALNPSFHAFADVDHASVLAQAMAAEAAVMAGGPLGPLHGIPVATKLPLAIKGMAWSDLTAGKTVIAERDSVEIERLRVAGAILLGPTSAGINLTNDPDFQPIRNPWDPNRTCGISSGGSACAVGAGMAPIAIGGDGYGSTRLPAAFCGVLGLHLTKGRVPSFEWGTLNSRPFTTYGPITRDVRDAAVVLSQLAGPDGRDLACLQSDPPDYLADIGKGVAGLRLGWTPDFRYARKYAVTETGRVIETVREVLSRLEHHGARIDELDVPFEEPIWAANQWTAMDPALGANDVFHFTGPSREDMIGARAVRERVWQRFRAITDTYDFIVTPTILEIAPTHADWDREGLPPDFSGIFVAMTAVANLLGWPAISVPAGFVDQMPVALQIIGRPDSEPGLLRIAQTICDAQAV